MHLIDNTVAFRNNGRSNKCVYGSTITNLYYARHVQCGCDHTIYSCPILITRVNSVIKKCRVVYVHVLVLYQYTFSFHIKMYSTVIIPLEKYLIHINQMIRLISYLLLKGTKATPHIFRFSALRKPTNPTMISLPEHYS